MCITALDEYLNEIVNEIQNRCDLIYSNLQENIIKYNIIDKANTESVCKTMYTHTKRSRIGLTISKNLIISIKFKTLREFWARKHSLGDVRLLRVQWVLRFWLPNISEVLIQPRMFKIFDVHERDVREKSKHWNSRFQLAESRLEFDHTVCFRKQIFKIDGLVSHNNSRSRTNKFILRKWYQGIHIWLMNSA